MPHKTRRLKHRSKKSRKPLAMGILAVVAIAVIVVAVYYVFFSQPAVPVVQGEVLFEVTWVDATNTTRNGNITIQLRDDKPITSGNFRTLVEQGKYDNTIFHRVIAGFMIQGGQIADSASTIKDEIGTDNRNVRGSIAMANTGAPDSASTQFFINLVNNGAASSTFDSSYTVFGNVISGMDVVDEISQVPVVANPAMNNEVSAPVNNVILVRATILP
jgi:peptidylprolyl isomerase